MAVPIHPGHYFYKHTVIYAPRVMKGSCLSTSGQPLVGQIRSRRICHSFATAMQFEIHWIYKNEYPAYSTSKLWLKRDLKIKPLFIFSLNDY
ncbi:hypothetical protein FE392_04415 [Xenorhabdus sp. 12]|uniref:Transposase n=1 Tax=Xenorhabdus santafensis TaxID=2582833 RepID=A0ABU4S6Z9_9GAMM|nr:hypothetical protein [Xenorhabdus sp. 12]